MDLQSTERINDKDINKLEKQYAEAKFTYLVISDTPFDYGREDILQTKQKEMSILGNPRAVEQYDEDGFLTMLNQAQGV